MTTFNSRDHKDLDADPKQYTRLCVEANLMINGNVKGTMCLNAKGLQLWRLICSQISSQLDKLRFIEIQLPTLISPDLWQMEKQHLTGFGPELYSVTINGHEHKQPLAVMRPTSELLFCDFFAKTLRSYIQLPLLYYQQVSVFRAEKNTKPFLRNCEFWWIEAHTLHENSADAERFLALINTIYRKFLTKNCLLNILTGQKTEIEKFAGAEQTITFETILPDGQALQCATIHNLGHNFTKPFRIKYQTKKNKYLNPTQTSFGLSTRLIGALILSHSDHDGLRLPTSLNPEPVAIICRLKKKSEWESEFRKQAELISRKLPGIVSIRYTKQIAREFPVLVKEGVGAIIILDQMLIRKQQVDLYTRFDRSMSKCLVSDLPTLIKENKIKNDLYLSARTSALQDNKIVTITSLSKLAPAINARKAVKAYFELNSKAETDIKKQTLASVRCYWQTILPGRCIFSKKLTKTLVIFGRSY